MRTLFRNMAIGAVLLSVNVLLMLPRALAEGATAQRAFLFQALVTLAAAGAAGGALFTALGPIRRRTILGNYLGWIIIIYFLLAVMVAVGTLGHGGDPSLLKEPAVLAFLLGSGAAMGVFCARVARRWSSGEDVLGIRNEARPHERDKRRRYKIASWFFAAVVLAIGTVARDRALTSTLLFIVLVVSFAAFLVTALIAASPSSVPRTILALMAVLAGLGLGFWIVVALKFEEPGRAAGPWFEAPFLVLCALAAAGCLLGAARLTRE